MKRTFLTVLGALAIAASTFAFLHLPHKQVSDQSLLREAKQEGAPLESIFGQQEGQGYYDDALETAKSIAANHPDRSKELAAMAEQVIQYRAENGDIGGARTMVKQLDPGLLGDNAPLAYRDIAVVQVDRGDLAGALAADPGDSNALFEHYGEMQIQRSDFDGALRTAEQMNERSAYDLFYDIGTALRERKEQSRLRELASHMGDRKKAREFVAAARFTLWIHPEELEAVQPTSCEMIWFDTNDGKFADAYDLAGRNHCPDTYIVYIATAQYPTNPVLAEQALGKVSDAKERSVGYVNLLEAAAKKQDANGALRFFNAAQAASGDRISVSTVSAKSHGRGQ